MGLIYTRHFQHWLAMWNASPTKTQVENKEEMMRSNLLPVKLALLPMAVFASFAFANDAQADTLADSSATPSIASGPQESSTTNNPSFTGPQTPSSDQPTTGRVDLQSLDKTLGVKGWNIPFPSYAETITQDPGGIRTAMANYGFGFLGYEEPLFAVNVLNRPSETNGKQVYWGQKPSFGNVLAGYLTYDLGKLGLEGGQLVAGGVWIRSTLDSYLPNSATVYRLDYYQSLLQGKVEFSAGLMDNSLTFVGSYVGGQVQSPFGPTANIPTEVGMSASSVTQPTMWLKVHPTESIYNLAAVARSISPSGIPTELNENPTNLNFHVDGGRALFIDEFGYQTQSHAHSPSTWFRVGGLYNTSNYQVIGTTRTQHNGAVYVGIDRQITQTNPDSETQAYRGLYLGASAQAASPSTNVISQYYELRAYVEGPFDSRPGDIVNLVVAHQKISNSFVQEVNATAPTTGFFSNRYSTSISTSYTARLYRGTYLTLGLQYQDHPTITYTSGPQSSLNFVASAFFVF
jgi:porin